MSKFLLLEKLSSIYNQIKTQHLPVFIRFCFEQFTYSNHQRHYVSGNHAPWYDWCSLLRSLLAVPKFPVGRVRRPPRGGGIGGASGWVGGWSWLLGVTVTAVTAFIIANRRNTCRLFLAFLSSLPCWRKVREVSVLCFTLTLWWIQCIDKPAKNTGKKI